MPYSSPSLRVCPVGASSGKKPLSPSLPILGECITGMCSRINFPLKKDNNTSRQAIRELLGKAFLHPKVVFHLDRLLSCLCCHPALYLGHQGFLMPVSSAHPAYLFGSKTSTLVPSTPGALPSLLLVGSLPFLPRRTATR